jgi:hypothetical protein
MELTNDIFEQQKEIIVGHVETDSGGLLLTDAIWESALPPTTLDRISIDLELPAGKIPVIAGMRNGKRFLIIDIDGVIPANHLTDDIPTDEKVALPPEEKTSFMATPEEDKEK